MSSKKLYVYRDCDSVRDRTLYLTDEQYAVFLWFKKEGYDFSIAEVREHTPEEITVDLIRGDGI